MANPESEEDHDRGVTPILASEHTVASSSGSEIASQDEEDDGQALLLRHTKVRVTGNNRTKSSLVGLTGVVKKAVGLGGWHWLVIHLLVSSPQSYQNKFWCILLHLDSSLVVNLLPSTSRCTDIHL